MILPELKDSAKTLYGLHRGALLLGAVQRLTQFPRPAYLELGLQVLPGGLAGGILPKGGRLVLDFERAVLSYIFSGKVRKSFELNDNTQAAVFNDLISYLALEGNELSAALPKGRENFERVSLGIAARGGRYGPPKRELFLDETKLEIDLHTSKAYFDALQAVFTGIARFQAQIGGLTTPLVVWPEHFDLSTLVFVGNQVDEGQAHTNFGFAPFSEGIDYPYLYAYGYPLVDRYPTPAMPKGAHWHTQGWTGAVLPYSAIAGQPDPVGFIEKSCEAIYTELQSILKA